MKADYFKYNPRLEVIYITSDGLAFAKKTDAKAHASSLKDKEVETVTKKAAEKLDENQEPDTGNDQTSASNDDNDLEDDTQPDDKNEPKQKK